ncbi:hypothetical protein DP939_37180 [Spongiactinospora rosea]|uniref:SH3 domain-containing protein n=1 Tax=Spongiactinospora rosea TaxID=2248750 RepID=A0A366LNQ8_9ACTN|nr:hypothetical protein [Spongiactinospora rosea]RBQ15039.1 hypothetical protein DP939_37180 [Spongiactinospora rosea]
MKLNRTTRVALALAAACVASAVPASAFAATSAPAAPEIQQAAPAALPAGYQIVTLPNANVPNFQRRTLYCPGTKKVLGGGAEAQGNGAILVGSFPTPDGRGWIGLGRQIGYNDVGISVYAICAD